MDYITKDELNGGFFVRRSYKEVLGLGNTEREVYAIIRSFTARSAERAYYGNQSYLARICGRSKSTVCRAISSLMHRGLVYKKSILIGGRMPGVGLAVNLGLEKDMIDKYLRKGEAEMREAIERCEASEKACPAALEECDSDGEICTAALKECDSNEKICTAEVEKPLNGGINSASSPERPVCSDAYHRSPERPVCSDTYHRSTNKKKSPARHARGDKRSEDKYNEDYFGVRYMSCDPEWFFEKALERSYGKEL